MRTCLSLALTAAVLAACPVLAAPAEETRDVKIAWHGQSFFQVISPKGTRVVLDPHNIEQYRITPIKADLVLMSHFHNDHNQIEGVIENYKDKDFKSHNALKKTGPNNTSTDWNLIDEKVNDVHFYSVATYHDNDKGLTRGKNGIWVLEIDGLRIAHLGDLGHKLTKEQLKKLGKVDVIMIPVGGVYTLNGLTAFEVAQQINPTRYVMPMHYGTRVFDDLLTEKAFVDECKENDVSIETVKPRQWLKIDPKSEAPKKWSVVLMDHMGPGMNEIPIKVKDKDKDKEKDKDKDDKDKDK